jgi:outer membrane protein
MKRLLIVLTLILATAFTAGAQTYGYLDAKKILEKMPEYIAAQSQLDNISEGYQAEIDEQMGRIENLFTRYQQEKPRLGETQRQIRENEIIALEREVKERQKLIFGQDGTLAKMTEEKMNPIRGRVQRAVEAVAAETGSGIIFDLAITQGVIFTNPRYDLTERVMRKLNLK